ncbi:hypothetical protein [Mesorhizobium sp.]|uniref:hypothetical protein n=1 Tax=Mesorhizobium sp. TaxID=1871066 RepID=UPI000FE9F18D|nr:hypothetical protein [Mesorhizobium sp.]RWO57052.1 MAG: hypothetical protein EOS14_24575 [Mesorhizobium sp.]
MGALITALLWARTNWKLIAFAAALAALAFTGWRLYEAGEASATQKHQIATLKQDLANAELIQKMQRIALEGDQERAAEDAKKITTLNDRISDLNEYVESLADRDRECLSGADTDRLRDLWK